MPIDRLFRKEHPPACTCVSCNNRRIEKQNYSVFPFKKNDSISSSEKNSTLEKGDSSICKGSMYDSSGRVIGEGSKFITHDEKGWGMKFLVFSCLLLFVLIGAVTFLEVFNGYDWIKEKYFSSQMGVLVEGENNEEIVKDVNGVGNGVAGEIIKISTNHWPRGCLVVEIKPTVDAISEVEYKVELYDGDGLRETQSISWTTVELTVKHSKQLKFSLTKHEYEIYHHAYINWFEDLKWMREETWFLEREHSVSDPNPLMEIFHVRMGKSSYNG